MPSYDFIIVGAGSAGCVLANRLSADPSIQVLLLEAGGRNRSLNIAIPARILSVIGKPSIHSYFRFSEPQPHLDDRKIFWPSGKGWGGTSAINGMAYMRGQREDYDGWASLGLKNWSYDHVLPYFKRSETNARGASFWHGNAGPLYVSDSSVLLPLSDVFMAAGLAAGYSLTEDFNGLDAHGFGRVQQTIRGRKRWSTASAYLHPVIHRPNLTIMNHCTVTRIVTRGTRAVSVEFARGREFLTADSREEIILSAGTVATPQLLLLSGIGDPVHLSALSIPVVADRKQVGTNLQDHVGVQLLQLCTKPVTLYNQTKGLGMLKAGLRYVFAGTGPAGGVGVDTYAAIRTSQSEKTPDIHVAFVNALIESLSIRRHGFSLNMWHLRPDSRGTISLRTANPLDDPIIQPNYLSEPKERHALREALKAMRHVVSQKPFDSYRGEELEPGSAVLTDSALDAFIRQRATGLWHPTSSARMGCDSDAVVNAELKVNGIENLRIADASVMPNVPSGNTNAPVIMIAEKASDMILRQEPLPRIESVSNIRSAA